MSDNKNDAARNTALQKSMLFWGIIGGLAGATVIAVTTLASFLSKSGHSLNREQSVGIGLGSGTGGILTGLFSATVRGICLAYGRSQAQANKVEERTGETDPLLQSQTDSNVNPSV